MAHEFDRAYWDDIWAGAGGSVGDDDSDRPAAMAANPPNPYLIREASRLVPGTALEAGCGAGTEALWLASQGWQVTGADIAAEALTIAARRSAELGLSGRVSWVEADLAVWEPPARYDLVTTHYAHPAIPQLDFYERLAGWVAPRGTLLIVGHLQHVGHGHAHGQHEVHGQHAGHDRSPQPPVEASATAQGITARLEADRWEIVTAEETSREMPGHGGAPVTVHDVVVTATRRH
ncbi:bifunctional 2-polyprenyl-6-hydroxyphenol methylase/3-demethylubiquinol 3-O-methyltransferase UbiG [Dietzia sp. KRD202]|uniref:class I SAM-dependent methyltransferase n=1 Tax=Dietzia sp. KRD202 TaxID=2729732 RepID=UPI0019D2FDF9|nr:class I SAM-dependent methyltransferase [Dietzia sp. KRD202]